MYLAIPAELGWPPRALEDQDAPDVDEVLAVVPNEDGQARQGQDGQGRSPDIFITWVWKMEEYVPLKDDVPITSPNRAFFPQCWIARG